MITDMTTIREEGDATETSSTVESRLQAIKRSVRRMTQEAFHQSRATNLYFDDDDNAQIAHAFQEEGSNKKELGRPGIELELFGQEASVIEEHVKHKLQQVESELESVLADFSQGIAAAAPERVIQQSSQQLDQEAALLMTKISFLKDCSQARASLDESSVAASATLGSEDLLAAVQHLMTALQVLEHAQAILQEYQHARNDLDNSKNELSIETMNDENSNSNNSNSHRNDILEKQHFLSEAGKMLTALQTTARRQKVHLMGRAKTLWQSSVELTSDSLVVRDSKPAGEGSDLQVAYDMFQAFGDDGKRNLQDMLRAFTKTLHETVFSSLLDKHQRGLVVGEWKFYEAEERSRAPTISVVATTAVTKGPTRRLEWICATEDEITGELLTDAMGSVMAWKGTFAFIDRIVSYFTKYVLLCRTELSDWASNRFFGRPEAIFGALNLEVLGLESRRLGNDDGLLIEPLLDALVESCIPRELNADELSQLESMSTELGRYVDSFLVSMRESRLLLDPSETRLAKFVETFDQQYIDKRRCIILETARELLVKNDYHNVVEVGVEIQENTESWNRDGLAVFKLHKSGISDTASKLMQLCRTTMDQSVEQHVLPKEAPLATLAATLYRTAREILDLFRAIIPSTHGYEIKNVPRTAAVFHNDCVFLAHHCLTLGLEYKERYPSTDADDLKGTLLRQSCMFVDMVPLFRDLVDRSMGDMLDLQASQLVELVGQRIPVLGDSLQSNEIVTEWSEAETALTAGVYHLRHVLQAWQPVLSSDILGRSMWYLCDVVFTLFLDQVLAANDISTSACQFVSALFQRAAQEIEELAHGNTKHSRVWDRFSAACKFMDMNLSDIQIALTDGVFQSVTGQELTRLIVATFSDSPKRREILNLLAAH